MTVIVAVADLTTASAGFTLAQPRLLALKKAVADGTRPGGELPASRECQR
jgi:hypothetical protein